eukprot:Awhi_evm1s4562
MLYERLKFLQTQVKEEKQKNKVLLQQQQQQQQVTNELGDLNDKNEAIKDLENQSTKLQLQHSELERELQQHHEKVSLEDQSSQQNQQEEKWHFLYSQLQKEVELLTRRNQEKNLEINELKKREEVHQQQLNQKREGGNDNAILGVTSIEELEKQYEKQIEQNEHELQSLRERQEQQQQQYQDMVVILEERGEKIKIMENLLYTQERETCKEKQVQEMERDLQMQEQYKQMQLQVQTQSEKYQLELQKYEEQQQQQVQSNHELTLKFEESKEKNKILEYLVTTQEKELGSYKQKHQQKQEEEQQQQEEQQQEQELQKQQQIASQKAAHNEDLKAYQARIQELENLLRNEVEKQHQQDQQ